VARVRVSNADHGRSFTARVGDDIVVELPEQPTTGYRWHVDEPKGALVLEADRFSAEEGAAIGGGGTRMFTFRAARPGAARLRLRLYREWEAESAPLEELSALIDVGG
jgi:inhibitor of cysteine peptidase